MPEFGAPEGRAELERFYDLSAIAFLGERSDAARERFATTRNPENIRVLRRGGQVVAGLSLLRMGQFFGGASVPMAGVASVAVSPEVRGSGAGSALMRSTLEELYTAGYRISVLYPATQPVYRRRGYEQAGVQLGHRIDTRRIDVHDRELELDVVVSASGRDALKRCYTARARRTSGNLDRNDQVWSRVLPDADENVHAYAVRRGSDVEGYVVFTQGSGRIDCRDLVALTPAAARRLLSFFADHRSQATTLAWHGSPAEPMLLVLDEQAHEITGRTLWMLRLVNVRDSLASRGYPDGLDAELHLDVRDDVLPWNHGRIVLETSGGKAKVRQGGRGRLKVDVRGLAAIYTGHASASELLVSGYVDGNDRDLAAAARIFGGPAPWMPDFF